MKKWSAVQRIVFVVLVGVVVGVGMALLASAGSPARQVWLTLALMVPMTVLMVGLVLHWMLWPSAKLQEEQARSQHSVEQQWFKEASADSFFGLFALLVWSDVVGTWTDTGWLSPLTLWHVLVCSVLVYAVNYLIVRFRSA